MAAVPASLFRGGRRSKYNARPTEYNGRTYHSALEARQAEKFDLLLRAGAIRLVESQVKFPLVVDSVLICTYVADFRVTWRDGCVQIIECKGFSTREWKIKKKLFEALYPDIELIVITR